MKGDFAIALTRQVPGYGDLYNGIVIGKQPEFQFVESGPWRLFDIRTGREHMIEYMMPTAIQSTSNVRTPEGTIRQYLQSMADDPFRVIPDVVNNELPTIMSFQQPKDSSFAALRFRCRCFFPNVRALEFADVRAALHHESIFARNSADIFKDVPLPSKVRLKLMKKKSFVDDYERAACNLELEVGMVLPFQVDSSSGTCNGACVLLQNQGASHFLCDVLVDRPIAVRAGDRLSRTVAFKGDTPVDDMTFESELAQIVEIST